MTRSVTKNGCSPHKMALVVLITLPGVRSRGNWSGALHPLGDPGTWLTRAVGCAAGNGLVKGAPRWLPGGGTLERQQCPALLRGSLGQGQRQQHKLHPGKVLLTPGKPCP